MKTLFELSVINYAKSAMNGQRFISKYSSQRIIQVRDNDVKIV